MNHHPERNTDQIMSSAVESLQLPVLGRGVSLDGSQPIYQYPVILHKPKASELFTIYSSHDVIVDTQKDRSIRTFPNVDPVTNRRISPTGISYKDILVNKESGKVTEYDLILQTPLDGITKQAIQKLADGYATDNGLQVDNVLPMLIPECRINSAAGVLLYLNENFMVGFGNEGVFFSEWLEQAIAGGKRRIIEPNLTVPPFRVEFEVCPARGALQDIEERTFDFSVIGGIKFQYPSFSDINDELKQVLSYDMDDPQAIFDIVKPYAHIEFPDVQRV